MVNKINLFSLTLLCGCNPFNYFPDSSMEETIEQIIFDKTGVEVDFSGETPEKK